MSRTLSVELKPRKGESTQALVSRVLKAGARQLPGYQPVPMQGGSVVLTVTVEDEEVEASIRKLPGVVQVYGDPAIAPFD